MDEGRFLSAVNQHRDMLYRIAYGWDADEILSNSSARPNNAHVDQCRREIRRRIDYYELIEPSQEIEDQVDEMVELMVETICSTSPTIRVAGDEYPAELVKARFEKITASHIDYVMECLRKNTTHIRNTKKYLLTALFNAPVTAKHFENAEFNHFYRGGGV